MEKGRRPASGTLAVLVILGLVLLGGIGYAIVFDVGIFRQVGR